MDRLCDSFKLVRIVCSCPAGKLRVRGAEDLVTDHYKVKDKSRAAVSVNAFNNEDLRNIIQCQNKLRVWFFNNSVPWDQNAYRLIPNSKLAELDDLYNKTIIEQSKLEKIFLDNYERDLPKQKVELGQLYDMIKFPKREHFRNRIRIERNEIPVPSPGDDPRAGWSEEQRNEYRAHVENEQKLAVNKALIDVAERVAKTVGHVYEKMSNYNGTKKGAFRDSTIENCKELSSLISTLNINSDPAIEGIRREIDSKLCKYTPDEIREDKRKQEEVRDASADILDSIGIFSAKRKQEIGVDGDDDLIEMNVG